MKFFASYKLQFFTAAFCFVAVIFLFSQPIFACSWDYLIWQNRSKNSEPYYRFIKNDKAGFINQTGKVVIEPTLNVYGNYQSGVINGLLQKNFEEYIDISTDEKVSKDYYYQNIGIFEGLSVKKIEDKYGYVNRKGNTTIEPNFIYAKDFSDGLAPVIVEGPCIYINYEAPCSEAITFPRGAATRPETECKFNFINKEGKLISTQTYFDIKDFSEGLAPVRTLDGWGYINRKGELAVPAQFEEAHSFSDGLALVKKDDLFGYINFLGAFVIEPQFKRAESFSNGLAPVGDYGDETVENEFYYINKNGKPATSDKFLLASHYFKGLAHVLVSESVKIEKKDDEELEIRKRTYAYINNKGKKIFTYIVEDEM